MREAIPIIDDNGDTVYIPADTLTVAIGRKDFKVFGVTLDAILEFLRWYHVLGGAMPITQASVARVMAPSEALYEYIRTTDGAIYAALYNNDPKHDLSWHFIYDCRGEVTGCTHAQDSRNPQSWRNAYDSKGKILARIYADGVKQNRSTL